MLQKAVAELRKPASGLARGAASSSSAPKGSPFAAPIPESKIVPEAGSKDELKQRRQEEIRQRQKEMTELLREKTMREVSSSASGVRPEGISHVLNSTENPAADLRIAGAEKLASEEQGGPKGIEPTRYGDWERRGRTYDF